MAMQDKTILAYMFILLSLVLSIYFYIRSDLLIPAGYDLSVDGVVISRNLLLIFILYIIAKIGFNLLNKKK